MLGWNMSEQWKRAPEFPGYEVSDQGRIRNVKTGRVLRAHRGLNGYLQVKLVRDGR